MPATHWLPSALACTLAGLLLFSSVIPPWELFHDELYYWAGAQRLGFGYVDHPPLAPWILRLATAIFGDGVLGLRIVPALCAGATTILTAQMARRFGAGVWGQSVAALAVATAPIFLTFFSFFSVNAIEVLLWCAITLAVVEWIRSENPWGWIWIGALFGIAALNKHTVALLALALAISLLGSPLRKELQRRWIWLGAALAIAIALPNLVWNFAHSWPSLEFYRSRSGGILPATLGDALTFQIVATNPANLLLTLPGLAYLLFSERLRPYRPLGIAFALLLIAILLSGQRRGDRIAGIYPVVFAAGAAYWESLWQAERATSSGARWGLWRRRGARIASAALPVLIGAFGVLLVPISLTLLPPAQVEAFFQEIDERPAIETGDVDQWLPLTLSGRLEWSRFAEEVFAAVDALPQELRERAVILAPHWLYASVLEYHGRGRNGPPIVSPHNAYAFWNDDAGDRDQVVAVAIPTEVLESIFEEVRPLTTFRCEYCTEWRSDLPVHLATGSRQPLPELLSEWRTYSIGRVPALSPSGTRAAASEPAESAPRP